MLDFPESMKGVGIQQEGDKLLFALVEAPGKVVWVKTFFLEDSLVKPLYTAEEEAAIFINSSQDSAERGKTGSKRSGLYEEGMAKAMSDEEGRSGEAAAGRIPDEIMKVAEKAAEIEKALLEAPLVSILPGKDCLIRQMKLQLKKRKEIDAVFSFEAEPLLPYPIEDAIIDKIPLESNQEGSTFLLFSAKKESLASHLAFWQKNQFEPEAVIPTALALSNYAKNAFSGETFFAAYLGEEETCLILMKQGKLTASQTASFGMSIGKEEISQWQKELLRMLFALERFLDGVECKELLLTGPITDHEPLHTAFLTFFKNNGFHLKTSGFDRFALPIGAALAPLSLFGEQVNFRQEEFSYPDPWKHLRTPLQTYLLLCVALFAAFFCFSHVFVEYHLDKVRNSYADLLGELNQPFLEFEKEFALKKETLPHESLQELSDSDLLARLNVLEERVQATPDLFPLQPHVPTVSDTLAWLGSLANQKGSEEETLPGIRLESFNYSLVKRPEQNKKKERYLVKVDFEFTSPTQKLAREFHDNLISKNAFVDPKSEVKWSSSHGKYHTSFYLKDKTNYPF